MTVADGGSDGVDRARWNAVHSRGDSELLTALRRELLTGALPDAVDATTIWPAWPLDVVGDMLRLDAGETLVDLACGNGDIGRWIAATAGAIVIGVDPSTEALTRARARAAGARATYVEGHFERTGLPDACADAVLIVDAFQFAPEAPAALREIARILRPGRRLVIAGPEPPGRSWDVDGLVVIERTETDGWRDRQRAFVEALRSRLDELVRDFGERGAADLLERPWEQMQDTYWHGLVVAERTTG